MSAAWHSEVGEVAAQSRPLAPATQDDLHGRSTLPPRLTRRPDQFSRRPFPDGVTGDRWRDQLWEQVAQAQTSRRPGPSRYQRWSTLAKSPTSRFCSRALATQRGARDTA